MPNSVSKGFCPFRRMAHHNTLINKPQPICEFQVSLPLIGIRINQDKPQKRETELTNTLRHIGWYRFDEPVPMAGLKPLLLKFCVHQWLETCVNDFNCSCFVRSLVASYLDNWAERLLGYELQRYIKLHPRSLIGQNKRHKDWLLIYYFQYFTTSVWNDKSVGHC